MTDGIIKADGTSRLMRATLPATYEEFKAQADAGTLPLDILFNEAGWSQLPTFLNKASLLKDATAALFGLSSDAVPDDVLNALSNALFNTNGVPTDINGNPIGVQLATGSYTGTGTSGSRNKNSLSASFSPKMVLIASNPSLHLLRFAIFAAGVGGIVACYPRADGNPIDGVGGIVSSTSGNVVNWYGYDAICQMNNIGEKYDYLIVG